MRCILFLCVRNSCRSQMAEGLARHFHGGQFKVASAGSEPSGLDRRAVQVMAEVGIDISGHESKSVDAFSGTAVDHVFTLCGEAREACPLWPADVAVHHRSFDDPVRLAEAAHSEEEALRHFRRVRDEISDWIRTLPEDLTRE